MKESLVIPSKIKHRPVSLFQHIVLWLGGTAVQYPIVCGVCNTPTKGNIITGYRLGCSCDKEVVG